MQTKNRNVVVSASIEDKCVICGVHSPYNSLAAEIWNFMDLLDFTCNGKGPLAPSVVLAF